MHKALKNRAYFPFYFIFFLFLILGAAFILLTSREESHLILNQLFFSPLHLFFQVITLAGDGFIVVIVGVILLFINYKSALQVVLSASLSGATTQLLKNFIFDEYDRPSWFFKYSSQNSIQTIEGMDLNIHFSFPSGHTTVAFALYVSILLLANNKKLTYALTLFALIVGFSRIYLSEHFFIDVYFGSIIGTVWALYTFHFLSNHNKKWFAKSLLNR